MERGSEVKIDRRTLIRAGYDWLFQSTFLARLTAEELEDCLGRLTWRWFDKSDCLTREGEMGDGAFLLVSGRAVVKQEVGGQVEVISYLSPGSFVGERSLARGEPAMANVEAVSPVQALHLAAPDFRHMMESSERFRTYIHDLGALRDRWSVLVARLSQNNFLRSLGTEDVERLLQAAALRTCTADETVFAAGEMGTEVYIVVRGRVSVRHGSGAGSQAQQLAVLGPGELLGLAAVMLEEPRTADVVALETTELLRIDSTAFMDIVARNPLVQRQLLQYLANIDRVDLRDKAVKRQHRHLVFVCSQERGLGVSTIAYGLAGRLRSIAPPVLVDLEGPVSAQRLQMNARSEMMAGIPVEVLTSPSAWGITVLWPKDPAQTGMLLAALRDEPALLRQETPVLVTGHPDSEPGKQALEEAEAIVFVRRASEPFSDMPVRRGQARYQAIRLEEGENLPLSTSRKSARIPDDASSVRQFWNGGDLEALTENHTPLGRACGRLERLVRGRSVGVALGGGGALGFAHVGLLKALEDEKIPVDYVAGVSFGSLVGALYVGGGVDALDTLIRRKYLLTGCVGGALASTTVFSWLVNRIVGKQRLGSTEIPFYPVGLDLTTGKEYVLAQGTLGLAVRSASCMPGAFPALMVGTSRLVDGGMVNNVPASTIWDAGGDFIISSNIIPPNPEGSRPPLGANRVAGPLLQVFARLDDTARSLYMFASQAGRDRSLMADFIFDLSVEGFNIYDFWHADRIAVAGEKQARRLLPNIIRAHREDNSIRF